MVNLDRRENPSCRLQWSFYLIKASVPKITGAAVLACATPSKVLSILIPDTFSPQNRQSDTWHGEAGSIEQFLSNQQEKHSRLQRSACQKFCAWFSWFMEKEAETNHPLEMSFVGSQGLAKTVPGLCLVIGEHCGGWNILSETRQDLEVTDSLPIEIWRWEREGKRGRERDSNVRVRKIAALYSIMGSLKAHTPDSESVF